MDDGAKKVHPGNGQRRNGDGGATGVLIFAVQVIMIRIIGYNDAQYLISGYAVSS